jgi:hypothetical protein
MADVMNSLFGMTPESIQRQRDNELQARALQFAQLNPQQAAQMAFYTAGSRLGDAGAGLLGAQDPVLQKATQRQALLQQADTTTPEGLAKLAQTLGSQGFGQEAMQVMDQARQAQLRVAQTGKAAAEQKKVELTTAQEEKLRSELTALGPDATEEQYLQVVRKYGDPDKIMSSIQTTQARKDSADAKIEAAKIQAAATIEAAKERGATQLQIAQLRADASRQIAQLTASLKQGQQGNKALPPSLQKEEGKDLETIDAYAGQLQALSPAIASLTPDEKTGKRQLELGPLKNLKYQAQLAAGNSTPEARAYEGLKSAVDTAVNLQVSAEKGVQTDKDVLRFAKALIAAYGSNDTQATYEALTRYQKALQSSQDKTKGRLESRRKSQGVGSYYEGSSQGQTVIKLD